ncbi:MAG: GTPase Era [Clostridia bacterium]|nr:GTPase Era [Clostridia bacterium]
MKSGFVAVVGKPNAGKSSLVNKLIGFDVSIITPKPQTTRFNIKGILTRKTSQIIFIDTPGVHIPRHKLGNYMMKGVKLATDSVDVILYLVDGAKPVLDEANKNIIEDIVKSKKKIILAINKVDDIKKENILRIIEEYDKYIESVGGHFKEIVPISVKKSDGLEILLDCIENNLPQGEYIYDPEDVTDISERDIAAEIIRSKSLKFLDEEIPHGINVVIERMKDRTTEAGNFVYDIEATIICKKDSHKPIIIGKDGQMLKRITNDARRDIEKTLDCRVNLKIWVKVRQDWDNNEAYLSNIKDKIR